jgi:hypothetical protein
MGAAPRIAHLLVDERVVVLEAALRIPWHADAIAVHSGGVDHLFARLHGRTAARSAVDVRPAERYRPVVMPLVNLAEYEARAATSPKARLSTTTTADRKAQKGSRSEGPLRLPCEWAATTRRSNRHHVPVEPLFGATGCASHPSGSIASRTDQLSEGRVAQASACQPSDKGCPEQSSSIRSPRVSRAPCVQG